MNIGVYKIENKVNGKCYYGSSVDMKRRLEKHKRHLFRGIHDNKHLQRAYEKYGADSFYYTPILICSRDSLRFYEQLVLDGYRATEDGYNICPVAGTCEGRRGVKLSTETCRRIALACTGRKQSAETVEKRASKIRGQKRSDSMKQKMRSIMLGKKKSPEHVANMIRAITGRKLSEEHKAKVAATSTGRIKSEETRKKLSLALKGRKCPPIPQEVREKISVSMKAYRASLKAQSFQAPQGAAPGPQGQ